MSSYLDWFIPLCIIISVFFTVTIIILTAATLVFRAQVNRKYDRGRPSD
ncbi:hypothetical protein ACE41H_23835 [Paenibacillus enshidis]|uniref:Uncharacterized protein n=1 Tax=Paenibacillus enshidis TaxID=1458439 RepID=A0ABV5B000_9BACL